MFKYFCELVNGGKYIRGLCSNSENENYYISKGFVIFETDFNCNNIYLEKISESVFVRKWQVMEDNTVINKPYQTSKESIDAKNISYRNQVNNLYPLEQRLDLIEKAIDNIANGNLLPSEYNDYIADKQHIYDEVFNGK